VVDDASAVKVVKLALGLILAAVTGDLLTPILIILKLNAAFVSALLSAVVVSISSVAEDNHVGVAVVVTVVITVITVITVVVPAVITIITVVTAITAITIVVTAISAITVVVAVVITVVASVTVVPATTITAMITTVPVAIISVTVVVVIPLDSTSIEFILDFPILTVVAFRELSMALLKSAVDPLITWVADHITENAMSLLAK